MAMLSDTQSSKSRNKDTRSLMDRMADKNKELNGNGPQITVVNVSADACLLDRMGGYNVMEDFVYGMYDGMVKEPTTGQFLKAWAQTAPFDFYMQHLKDRTVDWLEMYWGGESEKAPDLFPPHGKLNISMKMYDICVKCARAKLKKMKIPSAIQAEIMKDIESFREDIVDPHGARLKEFQKKFKEAEAAVNAGDDMVMTSMGFWKSKKEIEREEQAAKEKKERAQRLAEFKANRIAQEKALQNPQAKAKAKPKPKAKPTAKAKVVPKPTNEAPGNVGIPLPIANVDEDSKDSVPKLTKDAPMKADIPLPIANADEDSAHSESSPPDYAHSSSSTDVEQKPCESPRACVQSDTKMNDASLRADPQEDMLSTVIENAVSKAAEEEFRSDALIVPTARRNPHIGDGVRAFRTGDEKIVGDPCLHLDVTVEKHEPCCLWNIFKFNQ